MAGVDFRRGMPGDIQGPLVMGGVIDRSGGLGARYATYPSAAPQQSAGGGVDYVAQRLAQRSGSGGGASAAAPQAPYVPPPLPPVGPVPANNGNLPAVSAGTETGSMMPPTAPGVGWQNVGSGGGLNDRLGTRLQRQSMNQLSQGIY